MNRATIIAALGVIVCSAAFQAQALDPVRDINTVPVNAPNQPTPSWTAVGSRLVFLKDDGIHGAEPWVTDGTPGGTALLADINPGSSSSGATSLTVVNGVLYFFANDGTNGIELWRSDGTTAGTHIVADIFPGGSDGIANSVPNNVIPSINGILYFVGTTSKGNELWRSDGTAQGTYEVADIGPPNNFNSPTNLAVSGSRLFFAAGDSTHGNELWISDGTAAGTHQVSDINAGANSSNPSSLTPVQGGILFVADDRIHGRELWFADNSGQGAHLVADLNPGTPGLGVTGMIRYGDGAIVTTTIDTGDYWLVKANSGGATRLLDIGEAPNYGFQLFNGRLIFSFGQYPVGLWVTDGTAAGTVQLGTSQGLAPSSPIGFYSIVGSDAVYFFASVSGKVGQRDLWRTDGTAGGTYRYAAMPQPFTDGPMAQFQQKIYFDAGLTGANGVEPWVSDGTPAGTHMLGDLAPGPANSSPASYFVYNNRLYFEAGAGPGGSVLPFVSDGTAAGTLPLNSSVPVVPTASSTPGTLAALGNLALFFADDGVHGYQPWVSDGTFNGTHMLQDITPNSNVLRAPGDFYPFGSLAIFPADDGMHGLEPWVTDGTSAGTRLLADINPGSAPSNPVSVSTIDGAAPLDGLLYFYAEGEDGSGLWRTDGTTAGTVEVVNMPGGLSFFRVLNNQILFVHPGPLEQPRNAGNALWRTDGTAAGTYQVSRAVDVDPGSGMVVLNGVVYFSGQPATAAEDHFQLWRSDGTSAGTLQITNFGVNAPNSGIDFVFATTKAIIFQSCTSVCALYASDGTAGGTVKISSDTSPAGGAVLGNLLFYTVYGNNTTTLKVTDGTALGTIELLSYPGNQIGLAGAANGRMLISINDPILGPSLWSTDGTRAGTSLVSSSPLGGNLLQVGNTIYSTASTPAYGVELYALHGTAPNAADDNARTTSDTPVSVPVLANDGTWGAPLNPGTVALQTLPAHGMASVSSDGSVSYTPASGYSGGLDSFTYTVADMRGQTTMPATVSIIVAQPAGPAPGTAPSGSSSGGSGSSSSSSGSGGNSSSSGGGGGGGAFGGSTMLVLAVGALKRRRRAASLTSAGQALR